MAKELMETVYGKTSKYEIYRSGGYSDFVIYKNGSYWKGTFSSLAAAVERAKKEG